MGKYHSACGATDFGEIVLKPGEVDGWIKAGINSQITHLLDAGEQAQQQMPCNRSLKTVFTVEQGMHALTKDAFPVWVASFFLVGIFIGLLSDVGP